MKKIILAVAAVAAVLAVGQAEAHGRNGYRGGYNGGWVGPAVAGVVIGGVIGALVQQPRYVPQPQVIYQQPAPVYQQPSYSVSCVPAYTQDGRYLGCIR